MFNSDWSQFIPDLLGGIILLLLSAIVGGVIAYLRSIRFRNWVDRTYKKLSQDVTWLKGRWQALLIFGAFVALSLAVYLIYNDWWFIALSIVNFSIGLFFYRLLTNKNLAVTKRKEKARNSTFTPVPIQPGLGNSYLENRYINPPSGDKTLGGATFHFPAKSLIFDTDIPSHYYGIRRYDKSKEVECRLSKPLNHITSAYFLINSGNSKSIYSGEKIGEIILLFKDAPPHTTDLILGENVREWCPGNKGDYVRKTSSQSTVMDAWTGMNNEGTPAVIDCLQVSNYECMRSNYLEKIIFVHRPTKHLPEDEKGVHFSVFGISLEITNEES